VLDTVDDAVLALGNDGVVASANRSAGRLLGWGTDELAGVPFTSLFPPHWRADAADAIEVARTGGRVDHHETEMTRSDGMCVPVALSAVPVPGPAAVIGVAAVIQDLTEQRLSQARLAEAEERMRLGEELAGSGSWLWDLRTGAVQWSAMLHRLCAVDPLAFEGTLEAHLATAHPDDRPRLEAALAEAVRTVRPLAVSYRVLLPDGRVRWVEARGSPTTDSAGTVVGVHGIAREVPPPPAHEGA
jgi:PAS domain S-box-containing protein